MARTWDLRRTDTANWSERMMYFEIVRRYGQPVLDLGCGTGGIVLAFAAEGVDIDGLDNFREMLEICRQKARAERLAPGLHEQSIGDLSLPRTYRTILGPSSVLQLVPDPNGPFTH